MPSQVDLLWARRHIEWCRCRDLRAGAESGWDYSSRWLGEEQVPGGGGEYPLQDGFGWTNGVTSAVLERYPDLAPKR